MKNLFSITAMSLGLVLLSCVMARAELSVEATCTRNALGSCFILLDGPIGTGAFEKVEAVINGPREGNDVIYLNSPGGNLGEALRIGRLLREKGFHTKVGTGHDFVDEVFPHEGRCESACVYAFMGGERRTLRDGDVLGMHRFVAPGQVIDNAAAQQVSGMLISYMVEMGVDARAFTLASEEAAEGMRILTLSEAREFDLVTEDAYSELDLEPFGAGVIAWTRPDGPSAPGNVDQVTFFCRGGAPRVMFTMKGGAERVDFLSQPGFGKVQGQLDGVSLAAEQATITGRANGEDGYYVMSVSMDVARQLLVTTEATLTIWYPTAANGTMSATLTLTEMDQSKLRYTMENCIG